MLTLTRKVGERLVIGTDIEITVVEVVRGKVRLAISAPRTMPILRGEVIERIIDENKRAVPTMEISAVPETRLAIDFPEGILGLPAHRSFVVMDVEDRPGLRALVSTIDPSILLLVVEATELAPDYPVERARELSGHEETDVAVALVVTLPANSAVATVNLLAPIVIGMSSRRGVQVILEGMGLPVRCELIDIPDEIEAAH